VWRQAPAGLGPAEFVALRLRHLEQSVVTASKAGETDIPLTNPLAIGLLSAISCGADPGAPVTTKYKPPFPFTGKIYGVTVDVSGDLIKDEEAAVRMMLARQ
jgi:hypothetical protein